MRYTTGKGITDQKLSNRASINTADVKSSSVLRLFSRSLRHYSVMIFGRIPFTRQRLRIGADLRTTSYNGYHGYGTELKWDAFIVTRRASLPWPLRFLVYSRLFPCIYPLPFYPNLSMNALVSCLYYGTVPISPLLRTVFL